MFAEVVAAGVFRHAAEVLLFLVFAAAPVPLGYGLLATSGRRWSLPQAALAVLTVWCAAQALLAHALGLGGVLVPRAVIAAEILLLGGGALVAMRRRRGGAPIALPARAPAQGETVVLLAVAFVALTLAWWSAAMPVVDWDSWAYHMPPMADWLQSGWFTRMADGTTRARYSYPYGWEALCVPFLVPFGEDVLVTLPNLAAWAVLGLAVHQLARQFGARRAHALGAAALLLAVPGIAQVVNTMHVDVPFAAFFMAAAAFGVAWARTGAALDLGLAALAAGLACAARITAPVYIAFLAPWVLGVRLASPPRSATENAAPARWMMFAGVAVGLAIGGYWYAKNAADFGHPFGTAAVGTSIGPTPEHSFSTMLLTNVAPLELSSWTRLVRRAGGELDLAFVALALMTALWPLAWLRGARPALAPVLLAAGTLALFWVTPAGALSDIQIRLGLPFVASVAVVAAVAASAARLRPEVVAVMAALACARAIAHSRVTFALLGLAIACGLWRAAGRPRSRLLYGAAVIAGVIALAGALAVARQRREQERVAVYGPAYEYLERHVDPREPVAYLHTLRSYILFGRRLARKVVYAPLDDDVAVGDWAARLREQGISFVAIGPYGSDKELAAPARLREAADSIAPVVGKGTPGEVTLYRIQR